MRRRNATEGLAARALTLFARCPLFGNQIGSAVAARARARCRRASLRRLGAVKCPSEPNAMLGCVGRKRWPGRRLCSLRGEWKPQERMVILQIEPNGNLGRSD